jgi:hypothetical protein
MDVLGHDDVAEDFEVVRLRVSSRESRKVFFEDAVVRYGSRR